MKFKKVLLLALLCSSVLVGCEEHPSFKTSVDAVEGCKKELAELKEMDDVSVENLAKATSAWLEIQDSAYSVFSRDTTINLRSPVAMAYFVVSDSIRGELKRLAFANPRSLRDVMYLKLNTATARKKIEKSDVYKEALDFYDKLDKQDTYPNLTKTLIVYSALLHNAKPFKHESELLGFISEEDRCFRSLMKFLSQVSNEQLQQLTDATAGIFDGLYSSVGRKVDDVNDRTMLYLTMRFNRRIVQNALACKQDVENGKKLSRLQRANYRWMLIQPFMAIDDYHRMKLFSHIFKEVDMKTIPGEGKNIGAQIGGALLAGLAVMSELGRDRPAPAVFVEHHHDHAHGPHVYFKGSVDSPQDLASRAFDAGLNAGEHGVGLGHGR